MGIVLYYAMLDLAHAFTTRKTPSAAQRFTALFLWQVHLSLKVPYPCPPSSTYLAATTASPS